MSSSFLDVSHAQDEYSEMVAEMTDEEVYIACDEESVVVDRSLGVGEMRRALLEKIRQSM